MKWRGVFAVTILVVAACGASGDPNGSASNVTGGSGGSGASAASGGSGGSSASGGASGSGGSGFDSGNSGGSSGNGGACTNSAQCGAGEVCDPDGGVCVPGGGCGSDVFKITSVPPNMLLVLDRSCSMTSKVGGQSKWQIAVDSINGLTTTFKDQIRWGLIVFPDRAGAKCTQDPPAVPVAPGTESTIQTLLTAALVKGDPNFPDGPCVTNIDSAMEQASQEPAFADTTRQSFAVLITDGKQAGCNLAGGDTGTTKIITDMNAAGVSTFVVGFGGGTDPAQMNTFANAGGVPRNDPTTQYYQADNAADLAAALGAIAGSVIGCTYSLGSAPPDATKLYAFFDKQSVARDPTHQSGWDYDPVTNQITFYGGTCDDLKNNKPQVDVVYGCNQAPPG